jgi:hypothetical protein
MSVHILRPYSTDPKNLEPFLNHLNKFIIDKFYSKNRYQNFLRDFI